MATDICTPPRVGGGVKVVGTWPQNVIQKGTARNGAPVDHISVPESHGVGFKINPKTAIPGPLSAASEASGSSGQVSKSRLSKGVGDGESLAFSCWEEIANSTKS